MGNDKARQHIDFENAVEVTELLRDFLGQQLFDVFIEEFRNDMEAKGMKVRGGDILAVDTTMHQKFHDYFRERMYAYIGAPFTVDYPFEPRE